MYLLVKAGIERLKKTLDYAYYKARSFSEKEVQRTLLTLVIFLLLPFVKNLLNVPKQMMMCKKAS